MSPISRFDQDAVVWLAGHRVAWLDPVFVGLSIVGYAGLIWIALAPLVARLRGLPLFPTVALTAICVWSADLVSLAFKVVIARPRPSESIPTLDTLMGATDGQSMTSGHAATAAAGAAALSLLAPRAAPFFVLLAVAIVFSRVYVGVHYPSDVLAGAALGAAVALGATALVRPRLLPSAARRGSGAPPQPG